MLICQHLPGIISDLLCSYIELNRCIKKAVTASPTLMNRVWANDKLRQYTEFLVNKAYKYRQHSSMRYAPKHLHLHTPSNPLCSRWYDLEILKADLKPDSNPHLPVSSIWRESWTLCAGQERRLNDLTWTPAKNLSEILVETDHTHRRLQLRKRLPPTIRGKTKQKNTGDQPAQQASQFVWMFCDRNGSVTPRRAAHS